MYVSRWYSWPGGLDLKEAKLGGDLGFVKFLGIPGDAGTLSVTLAVRTDDHDLRHALSRPKRTSTARARTAARPEPVLRRRAARSRAPK